MVGCMCTAVSIIPLTVAASATHHGHATNFKIRMRRLCPFMIEDVCCHAALLRVLFVAIAEPHVVPCGCIVVCLGTCIDMEFPHIVHSPHGFGFEGQVHPHRSTESCSSDPDHMLSYNLHGRQWLIDVPSGKRAILSAQDGTLFARLVAVLDAMLAVQVPVVKEWHAHQFGEVGRRQDSEVAGAELPESDVLGGRGGANGAGEQAETGRKDASTQELPTAIDCCSEILKATACLMALNK